MKTSLYCDMNLAMTTGSRDLLGNQQLKGWQYSPTIVILKILKTVRWSFRKILRVVLFKKQNFRNNSQEQIRKYIVLIFVNLFIFKYNSEGLWGKFSSQIKLLFIPLFWKIFTVHKNNKLKSMHCLYYCWWHRCARTKGAYSIIRYLNFVYRVKLS